MDNDKVWTFFYGSYINFDVLKEVNLIPEKWELAHLTGFEIRIEPRANLVPSDAGIVYGIVATATHDELTRLYDHAQMVLGEVYLPQAVLVQTDDGAWMAALCYICQHMEPRPAETDYVDRILAPARRYGFPSWYLDRLTGYLPKGGGTSRIQS